MTEPKKLIEELKSLLEDPEATSAPCDKPYDITEAQDKLRIWMTKSLFYLIASFIAICVIAYIGWPEKYLNIKDILSGIFVPLITLFGTILGFYFGGKSASKND